MSYLNSSCTKIILLLEEDISGCSLWISALKLNGYPVIHVDNSAEAFKLSESETGINLFIIDDDAFPDIRRSNSLSPAIYIVSDEKPDLHDEKIITGEYMFVSRNSAVPVFISLVKSAVRLAETNTPVHPKVNYSFSHQSDYGLIPLQDIFNSIPSGIYIYQFEDPDKLYLVTGNIEAEKITGIKTDDWIGREFNELWPSAENFGIKQRYIDVALTGISAEFNEERYTDERLKGTYRVKVFSLRGDRLAVAFEDITKIKNAEDALRQSEAHYHLLADNMTDAVWLMDMNLMTTFHTPSSERLRGYTVEEVMQIPPHMQITEESYARAIPVFLEEKQKAMADPDYTVALSMELEFLKKDGSTLWTDCSFSLIRGKDGKPEKIMGVARDITERKSAEKEIKTLLQEKELLLQEVHHRIKNNMHTIASLLTLQADSVRGKNAASALTDASNRVMSMMLIYDKLYKSTNFSRLSARTYLTDLIESIALTIRLSSQIEIIREIDDFHLDIKILFPIGIILNELLTNSFKHAFTGRPEGIISISLKRIENIIEIYFSDNGNGTMPLPEETDSLGFGMNLVKILVKQIKGEIRQINTSGTQYRIVFPY